MDPADTTVLRTGSSTRIRIGSVLLLLAVVVGVFLGRWATFSPRPVIAGEIYRSNQPDRRDLLHAKERLGLAVVANLRGPTPDTDWYREEVETCCELGLDHRDFNFRATEWPTRSETRRLVAYLLTGPRPLLFHCKAGADRSGWAAAMTGEPLQDAMGELSWIDGHLCSLKDCVFHPMRVSRSRPHRKRMYSLPQRGSNTESRCATSQPSDGSCRPNETMGSASASACSARL